MDKDSSKIIDGKIISKTIKEEVKAEVMAIREKGGKPTLAVVLVGQDPASAVYVRNKKKACEFTGIESQSYELPETTTEAELLDIINRLNEDKGVHGILVQLPLPKQIDEQKILLAIKPQKDVDGFHPYNVGLLSIGEGTLLSCTPYGVIELLKRSGVAIEGKHCVVIGRSNIVGKPVASLLLRENGTVTICHSRTKDLPEITKQADILVAAVGIPRFVKSDMIKDGVVIIDVGIHRNADNTLCGDVAFDGCFDKAGKITPVPGGVGPMTIAMLMKNCVEAFKSQQ